MTRVVLHTVFWLSYLAQDTLLAFLWDRARLHALTVEEQLFRAVQICVPILPPKMIFTYFVLYRILDWVLKQSKPMFLAACWLVIALAAALFSIRVIEVFFTYPVLFGGLQGTLAYFSPFSFLFAFIDIGYITGIAIAIKQVRLQLAAKEREKILIKEKLETELKYLKNQTNPHFLFNTLNNIYGLARRKSDDTADVVMKLSNLLRFMIYETKNRFVKIGQEIKTLEDFINLEKIRYSRKLTVIFAKVIDDENEQIVPLLLIPFVENAFKHGTGEARFESFIHVDMKLDNGQLQFKIQNSKEANGSDEIRESIGLGNVKRQLELMYKEYNLKVQNGPTVFKVCLNVNLRSHANI